MKTLSAIRAAGTAAKNFDWKAAGFATWVFLAIIGAIALGAWFANPLRWLALAASLLAVAGGWCITFKLTQAVLSFRAARAKQMPVARPLRSVGFHTEPKMPPVKVAPPNFEPDVESILVNLGYTAKIAKQAVRKTRYMNLASMDASVAACLQSLQVGGAQ